MKQLFLTGLLGLAAVTTPSSAVANSSTLSIEHYAPIPCAVACGYWDVSGAAGFSACNSFPAGSYDQTLLRFTETTGVVDVETRPAVDYDTFLCTVGDPPVLIDSCRSFTSCVRTRDAHHGVAGLGGSPGGCTIGPCLCLVGCPEYLSLTWQALQNANGGTSDEFRVVSSNWSDHAPLPITIRGPAEIVDDTFVATPSQPADRRGGW